MRHNWLAIALLLFIGRAHVMHAQETDVEKLIEKPDPAIQAQIQKVFDALQKAGVDVRCDMDVCREVRTLKKLSEDKDKLVRQLAIFVVTIQSAEDTHVLIAAGILNLLDFPPRIPIRVLASYLDTANRQLRDFARMWFASQDHAGSSHEGAPPFKPVNYHDYLEYVQWKVNRKEDVPKPFIKYVFEQSSSRALLVFAHANSHGDVPARMQAIRKSIEARQQGIEPPIGKGQELEEERQTLARERREIELAEHIISNAIWLNKHGYVVRFEKALPEVEEALALLAEGEWWARLYVAHIMRRNPMLLKDNVMRQLREDENELVREATKPPPRQ
jgi:hypothetical protein